MFKLLYATKFSLLDIFFRISQIFSTEEILKWNYVSVSLSPLRGNSVGVEYVWTPAE